MSDQVLFFYRDRGEEKSEEDLAQPEACVMFDDGKPMTHGRLMGAAEQAILDMDIDDEEQVDLLVHVTKMLAPKKGGAWHIVSLSRKGWSADMVSPTTLEDIMGTE